MKFFIETVYVSFFYFVMGFFFDELTIDKMIPVDLSVQTVTSFWSSRIEKGTVRF